MGLVHSTWCESCARKSNCYVTNARPKCFVPLTNTTVVCPKCGRTDCIREFGKDFSVSAEKAGYKYKCINCNTYIEQTEPSTDGYACLKKVGAKANQTEPKCEECEHYGHKVKRCLLNKCKYTADTDCGWK